MKDEVKDRGRKMEDGGWGWGMEVGDYGSVMKDGGIEWKIEKEG